MSIAKCLFLKSAARQNIVRAVLGVMLGVTLISSDLQVQAVEPTAAFADSRSASIKMTCPGVYTLWKTDGPHDFDDVCRNQHINGCDNRCNRADCHHWGSYNGRTVQSDMLGRVAIDTGHRCWGRKSGHVTGCTRYRRSWTRCNVNNSHVGLNGSNGNVTEYHMCSKNPNRGRGHYIILDESGVAVCKYCNKNLGSTYHGKCKVTTQQTRTVRWESQVDYINSDGVATTDKPTGMGPEQYICRYGKEADLSVKALSSYSEGNIVGFKVIVNGVESELQGSDDPTSTGGFSAARWKNVITDYTTVQFHLYTNAGEVYLPEIILIPGVIITYSGNPETTNKYGDKVSTLPNGNMDIQIIEYGKSGIIKDNEYTKEGYEWTGEWNINPDGSGEVFKPNQEVTYDYLYNKYGATITVYAQWEPIKFDYSKAIVYSGNHHTTFKGSGDYDTASKMRPYVIDKTGAEVSIVRFDQPVKLLPNDYIRKYYVTLMNNEQWLEPNQSSKNAASQWVEYGFRGWTVDKALGTHPYYEDAITPVLGVNGWDTSYQLLNNHADSSRTQIIADGAWVTNLISTRNAKAELSAVWDANEMVLPNNVDGHVHPDTTESEFIGWTDKTYPDERIYNGTANNSLDPVGWSVVKGQPYRPYKDITIYGHWQRELHMYFQINGRDKYNNTAFETYGRLYDYNRTYDFGLVPHTRERETPGQCSLQQSTVVQPIGEMPIEAYGNFDGNGLNDHYFREEPDGSKFRFLGWTRNSVDANNLKALPDDDMIVFDAGHIKSIGITDNKVLYGCWETVLNIDFRLDRVLGTLQFTDGTEPNTSVQNVGAVTTGSTVQSILRPGEQGFYEIKIAGYDKWYPDRNVSVSVAFDQRIVDNYDNEGPWKDNLNPSTEEDLADDQSCGLNRKFVVRHDLDGRRFYMPNYIGTEQSYETSKGVTEYIAVFKISKPSYFWNTVHGKDEQTYVYGNIYITNNKDNIPEVEYPNGPLDSVISDLLTRIKVVE